MTNREAIENIKLLCGFKNDLQKKQRNQYTAKKYREEVEALSMAIAALEKQEVHTHADKIRALDDESLAAFLHNISTYSNHNADGETDFYMSVIYDDDEDDTVIIDSYADILKWLREDAE